MDRRIQMNPWAPSPLAAGHTKLQRHDGREGETEHEPRWNGPGAVLVSAQREPG